MAAGGDQGYEGRIERWVGEVGGCDVAFEVVNGDQWEPPRVGESLGRREADEERAYETGAYRDGDALYLVEAGAGVVERLLYDTVDAFEVGAGGHLRYDATVA